MSFKANVYKKAKEKKGAPAFSIWKTSVWRQACAVGWRFRETEGVKGNGTVDRKTGSESPSCDLQVMLWVFACVCVCTQTYLHQISCFIGPTVPVDLWPVEEKTGLLTEQLHSSVIMQVSLQTWWTNPNNPMFCVLLILLHQDTEHTGSLAVLHAASWLCKGYDLRNGQPTFKCVSVHVHLWSACVFAHLHAGGYLYFIAGIEKTNRG